ncbi:MAG: Isopentenyl-diphosphate delta-isomerase [Methanomassiliicoccales archaeon PtaU1.Bin124]|nr:MAG: Isopentenyl-diphosphate delta-isomerase [Methanomassiliicoccales archaeon PtaU1.Bin124]
MLKGKGWEGMKKIEKRKADHIQVTMDQNVCPEHNHWNDVKLIHDSLPELDLEEVDTKTVLFGKRLDMPLVVTAITGGFKQAEKINRNLAEACAEMRIGLGIGSQRAGIEHGDDGSYSVLKDYDVPLRIGNVGAPQLISQQRKRPFTMDQVRKARDMVDADVMAVHLNYLQEVAQPEGDTKAKGCMAKIRDLAKEMPTMVKETGAGISRETAQRLKGTGIIGMDVSGVSGTSFAAVEMYRAREMDEKRCAAIGQTFLDWGIPAPAALLEANVGLPMIASGGMLNGLHVACGLALGASSAGMARAVLPAALESPQAVMDRLALVRDELRVTMFLTGSKDVKALSKKGYVLTGRTDEWVRQRSV